MILRIFRVRTEPSRRADFENFFRNTAIPLMQKQKGLVELLPGAPRPETPDEFCMVMIWESVEALKAFVGEDWSNAHVHPDEEGIVADRWLDHYELVEL